MATWGMVCESDVMLLISNSGKTREVLELVALTRRMYPAYPSSSSRVIARVHSLSSSMSPSPRAIPQRYALWG